MFDGVFDDSCRLLAGEARYGKATAPEGSARDP
jgi:hypothetical protein